MKRPVLAATIVLTLAVGAVGARVLHARGLRFGDTPAPMEAPTFVVERRAIDLEVREVGTVEAFRKVDLKSKVPGQVARVLVDVGDRVKAGDVLVELDPVDKTHELDAAVARREAVRAQLAQAEEILRLKEAAFQNKALSMLDVTTSRGDVARLASQLRVDAAEVELRRDQLGYTRLRSPIDGVVLERNVQPGEMVTPGISAMVDGRPLLVVAQVDRLLVRTELSQLDVVHLRPEQPVEVRVDALPGLVLEGRVHRVSATGKKSERHKDANLLVFPVDVVVHRSQVGAERVLPGMLADLRIGHGAHKDAAAVPLEAIVRQGDKTLLRRAPVGQDAGAGTDLVEVTLGAQDETHVEIVQGAAIGERFALPRPMTTAPQG